GRADRLAAVERLQPHAAERVEHDPLAVGRLARPTQDARLQRTFVALLLPRHARREPVLGLHGERNLAHRAGLQRDALDLAVRGVDDALAVGRERVRGAQIELREAFLLVALRA